MKKSITIRSLFMLAIVTLLSFTGFSQVAIKSAQDTSNARLSLIKTASYSNSVTLNMIKQKNDTLAQTLRVIKQKNDTLAQTLRANNNVGGFTKKILNTVTTNAIAYSIGDNIGGINTITNASRTNAGTGTLTDIIVWSKEAQTFNATIDFWSASPGAGSYVNNAAQTIVGDEAVWLGSATLSTTDFITTGTISRAHLKNLNITLGNQAARNIFFTIVTTSAPTWAVGTTGVVIVTGVEQD